jgi:hypothetical protein
MKKILYIDSPSYKGHINFNRIQLNALASLSQNVDCVFKKGYYDELAVRNVRKWLEIPAFLYLNRNSKVAHRLLAVFHLLLIFIKMRFSKFDIIIFSMYDPVVLFFFRFKGKVFLFNHNNIVYLNNPVKLWFTKHLPFSYTHLVFNEHMKEGLLKYGITNIQMLQQHGPVEPFIFDMPEIGKIFDVKDDMRILFCPSDTSTDKDFIHNLLSSSSFVDFLTENKITVILKGNYQFDSFHSNVLLINRYLTEREYQNLFLLADIIFLPYIKNFKYRVSGILFSVFVNNKAVVVSNVEGIRAYSNSFKYDLFFDNLQQCQEKILMLLNMSKDTELYEFKIETATGVWIRLLDIK